MTVILNATCRPTPMRGMNPAGGRFLLGRRAGLLFVCALLLCLGAWPALAQTYNPNGITVANQLGSPAGVFVDGSGNIFVAEVGLHRIQKFVTGSTTGVTVAGGTRGTGVSQLDSPSDVFVDATTGDIFVADLNNNRIQKFPSTSTAGTAGVTVAGDASSANGSAANRFNQPSGVFVGGTANDIFVADFANHRIQKFPSNSTANTNGVTVAGDANGGPGGNGSAADKLDRPARVFVDGNGNIFVADLLNNRIQKFTPGNLTGVTVAGGNTPGGSNANQLDTPVDVFVDGSGNIFVADQGNNRIQMFPSNSTAATNGVTVAGGNTVGGSAANELDSPVGVFVNGSGIFVADAGNNRIQQFVPCLSAGSAQIITASASGMLGTGNCSVQITGTAIGSAFVLSDAVTGYVYSTVHRQSGTYPLVFPGITKPGAYKLEAFSTGSCSGNNTPATLTINVTGTACN